MNTKTHVISATCKRRLHVQGYQNYSDKELNDYKYGIRFAYALCIALVAIVENPEKLTTQIRSKLTMESGAN